MAHNMKVIGKCKAKGEGKFIHADGDFLINNDFLKIINFCALGTWVDDKANGYGVFTGINGSKYW